MRAPPLSPFTSDRPLGLGLAVGPILGRVAMDDHTVDDAVVQGFLRGHEVIAFHVLRDLVHLLSRVLGHDLLESPLEGDRLPGMDLDIGRLPLEAAPDLVNQDLGVRQRHPLSFRAACKEERAHRHRGPDADRLHVRLDELHRVVDREPVVHGAARRVDVDREVLVGILGLQMQELRDDQVRDLVVDGRSEEDDPLVEQAGVDVERALAARGLLDHHRDQRAHAGSLLPGVHSFVSVWGDSFSGVQMLSRARASSTGTRFASAATRSSALRSRRSTRRTSWRPLSNTWRTASSGSSSASSACSRIRSSISESVTSMPSWSATASSTSSRATESAASAPMRCTSSSALWPESWKYASALMPRLSRERPSPFSSSRVRASTSGPPTCTFEASTSVSTAAARNCVSASSSSTSRMRCSRSARSSSSVSNSLAARARSSSSGGSTFSLISFTSTVAFAAEPSACSNSTSFVSPADAPVSTRSISSTRRPEPSSTTRSRCPSPFSSSASTTRTSPVCAGRSSTGASSATDSRSASSSCSTSSSGTSGSPYGTSSCDQSAGSGLGCTATVAVNWNSSSSELGNS